MQCVTSCHSLPPDIDHYLRLVEQGRFYEFMMDKARNTGGDRDEFKESFFKHVFYAKKSYSNHLAKVFREQFPTVHRILTEIKAEEPREAPWRMQRLEADFVIDTCCRKLM